MKITLDIPDASAPLILDTLSKGFNYEETIVVSILDEQGEDVIDEETGLVVTEEVSNPISKAAFCKIMIIKMIKDRCKGFKRRERENAIAVDTDSDNAAIEGVNII